MKVFLIITMMILGDNQTMQGKVEVPNAQVCFQQAWKYLQQPQPEVAWLEVTCRFEPGEQAKSLDETLDNIGKRLSEFSR